MATVVIHTNVHLANQVESADWLQQGFKRHGIAAEITADRKKKAGTHVVMGPHYAFSDWLGADNVIWLDRCFYGHHRYDLSIGWLKPDGSRDFKNTGRAEPNGMLPDLLDKKKRQECAIVFGDYGCSPAKMIQFARNNYDRVYYKPHPAETGQASPVLAPRWTLDTCWELGDAAIGYSSTVLVEAELNGLHVHTEDKRHVCYQVDDREQWLIDLSWAQWSYSEIVNGNFWEHLC